MWYDLNETPYPETVRINGRPPLRELPPVLKGKGFNAEWKEIRGYEDVGLIYKSDSARAEAERARLRSQRWRDEKKQQMIAFSFDN